ncbi:uncharacterized protein FOMMEDRAFT_169974 [Fomitiporia mediterranea MF3/22]|uniref:uncharacterized protein n=1 Tax=Fomitiporia mediterranea (strain MF3/22) TaxID=694068 RepID=UPI0004407E71|nr:uncharacterized protein FOMMEDRAFT_169974 [Fomitiporia mediterranea MF3/22]EJD00582.1 hypothetical protein FOMMEDRAFT_169974 [Fomitiporia mediterranea MF3/22]
MNITPEIEAQLGEDAYSSLVSQYKDDILPDDHPLTLHVCRIVNTILEANDLGTVMSANGNSTHPSSSQSINGRGSYKDRQWRLAVISNNHIANSTASTGGIIVFTGLLSLCKDEHELASILGHEIAHAVARHLAERYSKAKDWSLKRLVFSPSYALQDQRQAQAIYEEMMATNMQFQELEADSIGLELTSRACFDPRAAIAVNQHLAALEDKLRRLHPELKPTHPCSEERIKNLEQLLPRAYDIVSSSPRCAQMRNAYAAFQQSSMTGPR